MLAKRPTTKMVLKKHWVSLVGVSCLVVAAGCVADGDSSPTTTVPVTPVVQPEPVTLAAQWTSRASNNEYANGQSEGYALVDEDAFLASVYTIQVSDAVVLPTEMVGYRVTQASLPSDETIEAIARAIGVRVPVRRHASLPDRPDYEPPADFAYWEAFDSSTGQSFTALRTGRYEYGLPVRFDFDGPHTVLGAPSDFRDTDDPLCELTEEPLIGVTRSEHCDGDRVIRVDEVTLPTEDDAEAIAAEVVAAAYPAAGELRFDTTTSTEIYPQMTVHVRPASPTLPLNWTFRFGADGRLREAFGSVGTLDGVTYPVVGLDEAVERVKDINIRWLAPVGIEPQTEPLPVEPPANDITIVDVEPALWGGQSPELLGTATYGHGFWLPAYAFVDSNGVRHVVPAVTDEYLL